MVIRNADYNREENSLIESDATAYFNAYEIPRPQPEPLLGLLNKAE